MIKEQYKISATDREACNWESLLARSPRNECSAYAALFREQMALEQEIGNNAYTEIYRLLVFVSDIRLQNNNDGLQPFICFDRSFDIIQVADGHMQFLIDSGLSINDPEMRARVCDLVWMRDKKNHLHGRAAVLAYLDAAVTLKDFDQWTDFFDRVRRAFQIARFIEKKGELAQKVIQFVENTIKTHYHEDPLFLTASLMELLQEDRLGDAKLYAQMAQSMAERFETQEEWFKARQYWKIVTKWHHLANDREAYRNTVINHAASIEQQAVSSALRGQHGLARSFLDDAIQLLRTIPQMDEKIDELIQKITEYQAPALSEFGRISVPVDLTAVIEKLNDQVMRGSGAESLMQLGLVCLDVDITVFREIVESSIDHSLAARLPLRRVGADGQTIDVIDGLNKENREKRILQKMYELAAMNQTTTAAIIEQGRLKIREGYTLTDEDINKLVENNIFIPKNRIRSIARGLRSGLEGDFLASSPTLVPQLENIIRYALKLQNVRTTGYDKKGIQEEISLTKMFEDHEHVLIDVFGEDIVFELRTLLIERSGYNFRNIHGHGLASDDDLESLISVFIWGITLHITCIGRMIQDRIDERLILESNQ